MRPWLRNLAVVTAFATVVPLAGLVGFELRHRQMAGVAERGERYYVPPPKLLASLCFGFHELVADLLWVRTISYYVDRLSSDRDYRHLKRYLYTILALDDHFKEVYRFGPSMFLLRGQGAQTNEDVLTAIDILKRGHERYPRNHQFAFSIGAYYMGELQSKDPEQKARWQREAADWIHRAALIGTDVPWLGTLAAKLYTKHGQRELAIKRLQELYLTTQDEQMKAQIAAKLRSMKDAHLADELAQQAKTFNQRWRKGPLAFISADLFVFLDLKRLEPFSLQSYYGRNDGTIKEREAKAQPATLPAAPPAPRHP